jgi:AAA domain, putative AbiEii toxin, Type IV TA system/AAA ATPase domain
MRIKTLLVQGFRGFRHLEMKDLGRVNLIVGMNNSGKTTVLEAINILMAYGNATSIWSALSRRGEDIRTDRDWQADIRRLFHDHQLEPNAVFHLVAETDDDTVQMFAKIQEDRSRGVEDRAAMPDLIESTDEILVPHSLLLSWRSKGPPKEFTATVPISRRGGVTYETLSWNSQIFDRYSFPLRFITSSSLTAETAAVLFSELVLTPEEEMMIDALRLIEPSIERIAPVNLERQTNGNARPPRGGIVVRLRESKDRIPISSMGDGIWHLLGLALFVVQSRGGILFVDEIDTGLHYTVMEGMWKFVYSAAKKYNVQVFATTHSRDCYESLAAIAHDTASDTSEVTIQRIERGREEAVAYSEGHILAAAKHDIEVR